MTDDALLPPMPDFDPRATRRAVRRGVARTAITVLAGLLVSVLAATVGSGMIQRRGDREQRMTDVLGTAFKIYNPSYDIEVRNWGATTPLSMSFTVAARPVRAVGGFVEGYGGAEHVVTQDFFGHVGRLPLGASAGTTLNLALMNVGTGNQPKEDSRKVLARLPEGLNALAVVEFATPLTIDELTSFTGRYKSYADKVVFERRPRSIPITWGGTTTWDRAPMPGEDDEPLKSDLANFRRWVGILKDYDDDNLRDFDLSLARLRKAVNDGLAYAYVDSLVTIGELRKIIEDPLVRTVRVADVAYDLERP
ncbi:hypothetical protein OHB01_04745 [Microbispora hainanensis]|jgi:hypothetical protein|uniref:Uncharacterized protein n=1 Tax=Microbispora hainanensis TaxID=568844 RepID=A0ABZ1SRD1_9ACTN|nr:MULTISPECIES: hypothetical protein [Microbispora]NJP27955.1 hypothetical protein [Microbispora sp. CL1-1]TQS10481.1 hypothetical protein FLW53_27850 [Microbispora sp. SCL1-1]